MKTLKWIVFIGILCCSGNCGFFGEKQGLEITRNNASKYRIIIADGASPSTVHGALELQMFLFRMTDAVIPIYSDRLPLTSREIMLGDNAHLRALDLTVDFAKLGDEGYVIRTAGRHLIIAGGAQRGTMYGVYGLLEDHLGCRWFTAEVSRIPRSERLVVPALDETVVPPLEYREPYVWEAFDGNWAARNRMNRNSKDGGLEARHGGRIEWVPGMFVHTFETLVPHAKYFREHPEYYSLVKGRRLGSHSQLCCTNDDVVKIVTEEVLEAFRENPQAHVLSISQNDWDNHCECRKCRALAESEGSDIAPVLLMVNRVAEAVEKEFPDKVIETLAYQWTRKPPKTIRPRHNVVIRLCTIECCFSHPLETCSSQENRDFVSDLRAWSQVTDRIWIWDYVTSFRHYFTPYPNLRVRDDNIRLFVRNDVKAVFEQDVYTTPNGEFSGLSGYLNAKLLWNPSYDENTAIDEFLEGVYGRAAAPIRAYIDMIHDKVEYDNIHMGIWQGPDADYLTDDILARADSLWEQAEAAVADCPEVLERVKTARLSVDYAIISRDRTRGDALIVDQKELRLTVNPAFTDRVGRFCSTAQRAGVLRLREYGYTVDEYRADLDSLVKPRSLTLTNPVMVKNLLPGLIRRLYRGPWEGIPRFGSLRHDSIGTVDRFQLPEHGEEESFGLIFEGFISVPRDGVYTFYTRSADGSKLVIGPTTVVDNGGNHAVLERMGFIALKAGMHPVKLSYFTRGKITALYVFYRGPGIEKQHIPESALFHAKQ
ncbi:DUF4838 domain-containing protein [bacterium]|nr:DUF4838 domain-containing protein [bacterium]